VAAGNMTKTSFYIRLSQGKEPIDTAGDKLIVTYSNPYIYGVIKDDTKTGAAITEVVGDGDTLIEYGERWLVEVTYSTVAGAGVLNSTSVYSQAYDTFRLELRPSTGAVLAIERTIPAVNTAIMVLE
jgi:archaellin